MSQDLYGFLGGIALSGARYKIEIIQLGGGAYQANAYNAGGATAWTAPTLVAEGELPDVIRAASNQFASKTKPGRDRVYTTPMNGGSRTPPFPKGVSVLPDHPLCWVVGQPLTKLPSELRGRAILAPGQGLVAPALPVPVAPSGPTPPTRRSTRAATATAVSTLPAIGSAEHPPLGQIVMLCETIANADHLELLLDSEQHALTEKMEGHRVQGHHDEEGEAYLTNRSGERIGCPPHIEEELRKTPRGTSLDAELITVDQDGRPQLYVGARANIQLLVVFDLLAHPVYPYGAMRQPQIVRLQKLEIMFEMFRPPIIAEEGAIRCVAWASTPAAKRELFAEIRARKGEGVVMRDKMAGYVGQRSTAWMRWRDRLAEIDAVVMDYKRGRGKYANTVGAVEVGLYAADGTLHSIGWAGSGWDDDQRAELMARWEAGSTGYVVTIQSFGLSFDDQVTRPSGIRIRNRGDKRAEECRFESEVGRPAGAMLE